MRNHMKDSPVPLLPSQSYHEDLAWKLMEVCIRNSKIFRKYNYSKPIILKWARELEHLESDLEGDRVRLDEVFHWYLDHLGGKWIPEAFSGGAFRKKFIPIEAAKQRNQQKDPA